MLRQGESFHEPSAIMGIQWIDVALFSTIFVGLLLLLSYCWRWRHYFELGMKLPGPPALPLIGNYLYFTTSNSCKWFQEFHEIPSTYGPITRLWFGPVLLVILTDPDGIEKVVKHDKIGTRGYIARKSTGPCFRNGLLAIDGDRWRKHRKIVSSALRINILETFVENFVKNSEILANKLKIISDGDKTHDIVPYFTRCSLDIMYQTVFRTEMNVQITEDNSTWNGFETALDMGMERLIKPWLFIDWIFNASQLGKKYQSSFKCFHDKLYKELEVMTRVTGFSEKGRLKDKKLSLMDILIQNGDMNKEDIVGEITTFILAGTETTSHACCYALALLAENPHIQDRIMQEQEDIFGEDILRSVRKEDLPRMEYLEQVLKEAMRIFPPVAIHWRAAVKEIDLGNGHVIPKGANVLMPAYSIHRDPKLFPDPEKFNPDRFSPQNCADRHPYAYTPFGIGRRMCVGHMFATMEAKVILSTVLRRHYITEIEGGIKGLEKTLKVSFTLPNANGIRVKLLSRSHHSNVNAA